jgi:DNA helicase-2/ATP-dependent DNA helicase PcrA
MLSDNIKQMSWLDSLNSEQLLAVKTTEGPVLVLSGAGTGKTRVLTSRFAYIVLTELAKSQNVLAVTFTKKATQEMRDRILLMINTKDEQLWVGTFHSICHRILRQHARCIGLNNDFAIYDTNDQLRLIKQIIKEKKFDFKESKSALEMIQLLKDRNITPKMYEEIANSIEDIASLYHSYQNHLNILNACDFGDLLLHCITIFKNYQDILNEYQNQFQYILVDEYQDTNLAQNEWLNLLASKHRNICCVGDDDQSIYSWRGAEITNILNFNKNYPETKIVYLEKNYRSTKDIINVAADLIDNNTQRHPKRMQLGKSTDEISAIVDIYQLRDESEEANFVVNKIEAIKKTTKLNELAILVRVRYQIYKFEEKLKKANISYKIFGGLSFYDHQEILDALAYLRVVLNPDDDRAFERIVNVPSREVGTVTMRKIRTIAYNQNISLVNAARQLNKPSQLKSLLLDFDRWHSLISIISNAELLKKILGESKYLAMWYRKNSEERLKNLKKLIKNIDNSGDNIKAFLERIPPSMNDKLHEIDNDKEYLNIMTLHGAKGLEFDVVFLPGWEEGKVPLIRDNNLEEERRLAYVGLTRARKKVYISYSKYKYVYNDYECIQLSNQPSRFIKELPSESCRITRR